MCVKRKQKNTCVKAALRNINLICVLTTLCLTQICVSHGRCLKLQHITLFFGELKAILYGHFDFHKFLHY